MKPNQRIVTLTSTMSIIRFDVHEEGEGWTIYDRVTDGACVHVILRMPEEEQAKLMAHTATSFFRRAVRTKAAPDRPTNKGETPR